MTRRTTLELDEALLEQAQAILGTSGIRDTVEMAFKELIRAELRAKLKLRLATRDGIDLSPADFAVVRPRR